MTPLCDDPVRFTLRLGGRHPPAPPFRQFLRTDDKARNVLYIELLRRRRAKEYVQGDTEEFGKHLFDLVQTLLAAGGPLLQLPTVQAG